MNQIEQLKKLLIKQKDQTSIRYAVIYDALEDDHPIEYLKKWHGNKGMLYNMDSSFFIYFADDILKVIDESDFIPDESLRFNLNNFISVASFYAYQFEMERILLQLNIIENEDLIYLKTAI